MTVEEKWVKDIKHTPQNAKIYKYVYEFAVTHGSDI